MFSRRRHLFFLSALSPLLATLPTLVNAQSRLVPGAIGSLERLQGRVTRTASGGVQNLSVGQSVFEGDRVSAAEDTDAVFRLIDGAVIAIRANSEITLTQYRFSKESPQEGSVVLQVIRGGLRKLTGVIGKNTPDNVRVTTSTATIGIRGTEFEVTHVEANNTSGQRNNDDPQPGSYLRVYSGATTLTNNEDNRLISVPAGQTAFAPNTAARAMGMVMQNFGLMRNAPSRAFSNGRFDGVMQSLNTVVSEEIQNRSNQQMERISPELRRNLPDVTNIFRR